MDETWSGAVAGSVTRSYNTDFRIGGLGVNGTTVLLAYDDDGLLIKAGELALTRNTLDGLLARTALAATVTTQSYNPFGELIQLGATQGGVALLDIQYTRDSAGRVIQQTDVMSGQTDMRVFSYDVAGRLTGVMRNGVSMSYSYDANGNRVSQNSIAATYDDQDRLLSYAGTSYTYTANGELKTKSGNNQITAYGYDVLGNLTEIVLPDGTNVEYLIDGRSRRVGKKIKGSLVQGFLYEDDLRPIAELDSTGAVVSRFVYASHDNAPDYLIKGSTLYRILTDHLGSPLLVVNSADGTVAQRLDYDAFGNVLADSSPGFQPFGFAGGLYDPQTKLVRFGARDYDAEIGRWTAKDPILFGGGDTNLYAYVFNDPINVRDPAGLDPPNGPRPNLTPPNLPVQRQDLLPPQEPPKQPCPPDPSLMQSLQNGHFKEDAAHKAWKAAQPWIEHEKGVPDSVTEAKAKWERQWWNMAKGNLPPTIGPYSFPSIDF